MSFMTEELGLPEADVQKILVKSPKLLSYGVEGMRKKQRYFEEGLQLGAKEVSVNDEIAPDGSGVVWHATGRMVGAQQGQVLWDRHVACVRAHVLCNACSKWLPLHFHFLHVISRGCRCRPLYPDALNCWVTEWTQWNLRWNSSRRWEKKKTGPTGYPSRYINI